MRVRRNVRHGHVPNARHSLYLVSTVENRDYASPALARRVQGGSRRGARSFHHDLSGPADAARRVCGDAWADVVNTPPARVPSRGCPGRSRDARLLRGPEPTVGSAARRLTTRSESSTSSSGRISAGRRTCRLDRGQRLPGDARELGLHLGHWPVIIGIAIALYLYRPDRYYLLRNALFVSGAIGFLFFAFFPVAPPGSSGSDSWTPLRQSSRTVRCSRRG